MKANFETIKRMIGKGESEALEFKEKFDKESIETAAAFANAKGGLILVGVSDNSEVKGVKIGKDAIVIINTIIKLDCSLKIQSDNAMPMDAYKKPRKNICQGRFSAFKGNSSDSTTMA